MRVWLAALLALATLAAPRDAGAVDRSCPAGKVWDESSGTCAPRKKPAMTPARKLAIAQKLLRGRPDAAARQRALSLLAEACAADHAQACMAHGDALQAPQAALTDTAAALAAYERACRNESGPGCRRAAVLVTRGLVPEVPPERARELLELGCKDGDGPSCFELGEHHRVGLSGEPGPAAAAGAYTRAAELLAPACTARRTDGCAVLGRMYLDGLGVAVDRDRGARLLDLGCKRREVASCRALAGSWIGAGAARPGKQRARALFEQVCRQGDAEACERAAELALDAAGTDKQRRASVALAERACDLDTRHCLALARVYRDGIGVTGDAARAGELAQAACERGAARACFEAATARRTTDGDDSGEALLTRGCAIGDAASCAALAARASAPARAYQLAALACARDHAASCLRAGALLEAKREPAPHLGEALAHYERACAAALAPGCLEAARLHGAATAATADPDRTALLLERACELGEATGCTRLGDLHYRGKGVQEDPLAAAAAFERACSLGAGPPCGWIDSLLAAGPAPAETVERARRTLHEACTRAESNPGACVALVQIYTRGGVIAEKDERRAFELLDDACQRGQQRACGELAHRYEQGIGVARDVTKAKALFREQCDGAAPAACVWLGEQLLREGADGEAVALLERACEQSSGAACNLLGEARAAGRGTTWDLAIARGLFERGCELGDAGACTNLGDLYGWGLGVPREPALALAHYERGCTPTRSIGCGALGRMHRDGEATPAAPVRAAQLLDRACKGSSWRAARACLDLAAATGTGRRPGARVAAALTQRAIQLADAAQASDPRAGHVLGQIHRDGLGVVADTGRAIEHFERACAAFHAPSCASAGALMLGAARAPGQYEAAAVKLDRACAAGLEDACDRAADARTGAERARAASKARTLPTADPRGSRGCGCGVGTRDASWLFGLALVLVSLRRRR